MVPDRGVIFVATKNADKFRELSILWGDDPRLPRLTPPPPEYSNVDEVELTYQGNALLKARALSQLVKAPALADDSGIEVAALGGAPGVRSARTPRADASAAERNEWILAELAGMPGESRRARMVCACAFVAPGADDLVECGEIEGEIADAPGGHGGFGYDAIFVYPPFRMRLAEAGEEKKNEVSHRARAIRGLQEQLIRRLGRS